MSKQWPSECGMALTCREGFNAVFPLEHLKCLYEDEIETMLCGTREQWTVDMLADTIKFDHGYVPWNPTACAGRAWKRLLLIVESEAWSNHMKTQFSPALEAI